MDLSLYFAWVKNALVVLVAWIDDVMILGPPAMVEQVQKDLEVAFTCKQEGKLKEYFGSKFTLICSSMGLGVVKFTQPVLVCKVEEEYMSSKGTALKTPAFMGQVLVKRDGNEESQKMYQSATATCMYVMQWSCPDTFHAVHILALHMTVPREAHA